ncbi:MAG TPA: hypothetical protein VGX16_06690 [Solirubrobacteraceae bacterium]|jgi:hypothetical protein|nr:hypothetical protein [Solirubrobacteraceae bacterium]
MRRQIQLIRELIEDSLYAVDEVAVAEAVLMRASARREIPGAAFRNDVRELPVRSFRPSRHAPSFRPCNVARSSLDHAAVSSWRRG